MTFQEAGRKGGLALFAKVGSEGMSARGKLGGRPRSLNYSELKQRGLLRQIKIQKEEELYRREFQSDILAKLLANR